MSGPKLIVKHQITLFSKVILAVFILIVLLSIYFTGRYLALNDREQLVDKVNWLEGKLDEYQLAYQNANENLVMQAQSAKVDNQSNQQLIDNIKTLKQNQRELEGELKFYRDIMAPELSKKGLTIAEFEMSKDRSDEATVFKLVLTQAGKQDYSIKGDVKLMLLGAINGKPAKFDFRKLGKFQKKHFQFQFRYFQNIEGEVKLPENFIVEQVKIVAKTRGLKKNQVVEKEIDWSI